MTKINAEKFKNAIPGSYGVQAVIAKKLQVTRSAVTHYMNKNPNMVKLCKQEREKIIDVSENRLFSAANEGKTWAINKILNTIGKDRGYVETQQIEHSGKIDNKMEVEIIEIIKKEDEDSDDSSVPKD